jgi:acyl-CoA reductase-like NAD-dependent aldehyde dehydrogenase
MPDPGPSTAPMMRTEPYLLAGEWRSSGPTDAIVDPYRGTDLAAVHRARGEDVEAAIVAAQVGQRAMAGLSTWDRAEILTGIARGIRESADELAGLIRDEVGKPITYARGEVARAVETFTLGAEEARRWGGEVVPVDIQERTRGYAGLFSRFPRGPVLAISPFNFPLNLAAHKLAPAFAVGSAVVLKPPPQGPSAALRLGRIALEAGLPPEALSVLPCSVEAAQAMAEDPRFQMLSFTGSARVGWMLKSVAGKKRVALELGGNAAAVVHEDADLEWAAKRIALGAFAYAGQVCISAQRVFVHEAVRKEFQDRLVREVSSLGVGDPRDEGVVIGPLIDAEAADRVEAWVQEALDLGAEALIRGARKGGVMGPTLLTGVPGGARVSCEEVFGPVALMEGYESFSEAIQAVNDSVYGLHAGLFTQDVDRIHRAFREIEVGGLVVNEFPMLRVDNHPYGGVKDSGFGREGVRHAMEEMSEPRMLLIRFPPPN